MAVVIIQKGKLVGVLMVVFGGCTGGCAGGCADSAVSCAGGATGGGAVASFFGGKKVRAFFEPGALLTVSIFLFCASLILLACLLAGYPLLLCSI